MKKRFLDLIVGIKNGFSVRVPPKCLLENEVVYLVVYICNKSPTYFTYDGTALKKLSKKQGRAIQEVVDSIKYSTRPFDPP